MISSSISKDIRGFLHGIQEVVVLILVSYQQWYQWFVCSCG